MFNFLIVYHALSLQTFIDTVLLHFPASTLCCQDQIGNLVTVVSIHRKILRIISLVIPKIWLSLLRCVYWMSHNLAVSLHQKLDLHSLRHILCGFHIKFVIFFVISLCIVRALNFRCFLSVFRNWVFMKFDNFTDHFFLWSFNTKTITCCLTILLR